jgi:all-trans-retinol 13,14-reductase
VVLKNNEIARFVEEGGAIQYAESRSGVKYYGKMFISNIHPQKTLEMIQTDKIKKAYRNRIKSLENSISTFTLNIVLKKKVIKYVNQNYYFFKENDPWCVSGYTKENWPKGYALFYTASRDSDEYADAVTLMTYMRFDEVEKWKDTFNIVSREEHRGHDYDTFKKEKAEKFLDYVEERFPGLRDAVDTYYVSTPLTLRDYVGSDDGSLYGIVKDYRDPMKTFISPRTKIENMYLTGQNLNLHGVLGVTVSAVLTCGQIIGIDYLVDKIRNA